MKAQYPGSGRNIPAIWHGTGVCHGVFDLRNVVLKTRFCSVQFYFDRGLHLLHPTQGSSRATSCACCRRASRWRRPSRKKRTRVSRPASPPPHRKAPPPPTSPTSPPTPRPILRHSHRTHYTWFLVQVRDQVRTVLRCIWLHSQAIVLCDWPAENESDLGLRKGAVIRVSKKDGEWWTGTSLGASN